MLLAPPSFAGGKSGKASKTLLGIGQGTLGQQPPEMFQPKNKERDIPPAPQTVSPSGKAPEQIQDQRNPRK
jgi:hypothetical protein